MGEDEGEGEKEYFLTQTFFRQGRWKRKKIKKKVL